MSLLAVTNHVERVLISSKEKWTIYPGYLLTTYWIYITGMLLSGLCWEYACQVWHPGLTIGQTDRLEHLQDLKFIVPEADYDLALEIAELKGLDDRREGLCKSFFKNVCLPYHWLNYLLPEKRPVNHDTSWNSSMYYRQIQ